METFLGGLIVIALLVTTQAGRIFLAVFVIIMVICAVILATDKSYEIRVQEVVQKEAHNGAYSLCAYLNALEILNETLEAYDIGKVLYSFIYPSDKSSFDGWFHFCIETSIRDHEWLHDYLFTVDVEEDIRNRKKWANEGIYPPPPLAKWQRFYETGTIWKDLTDDQLFEISMWINNEKRVECTLDGSFTNLKGELLSYYCKEKEIGIYLSAIAQAVREKFPKYDVEQNSGSVTVKPRK